jgi:hypothetical protein
MIRNIRPALVLILPPVSDRRPPHKSTRENRNYFANPWELNRWLRHENPARVRPEAGFREPSLMHVSDRGLYPSYLLPPPPVGKRPHRSLARCNIVPASRFIAGAAGFLLLIQCREGPER